MPGWDSSGQSSARRVVLAKIQAQRFGPANALAGYRSEISGDLRRKVLPTYTCVMDVHLPLPVLASTNLTDPMPPTF